MYLNFMGAINGEQDCKLSKSALSRCYFPLLPCFILYVRLCVKCAAKGRESIGRAKRQAICQSEEGRGRGAICSNILLISRRQQQQQPQPPPCQSGSQGAGICHCIAATAVTSMLMTKCDTWKYNKQTADTCACTHAHTRTRPLSHGGTARRDRSGQGK